jgi:subtilisin family serine protease
VSIKSTRILSILVLLLVLALGAGEAPVNAGEAPVNAGEAPVNAGEAPVNAGEAPVNAGEASEVIQGQYIVVFRDGVAAGARQAAGQAVEHDGGQVLRTYSSLFTGFAASLPDQALNNLSRNPHIAYIEADQTVSTAGSQSNATWGLDRIDQRALPLNGIYHYESTGAGVTAYIIDTGIRTSHNEFGGRAIQGFDAFGGNSEDCNGHGTHVAGTVGGAVYGVAKEVTLVAVRVLDCNGSGSWSGVVAGMDWVAAQASGPSVANMSLGGGSSTAVNDAVSRMVNAGVPVVVAAGNGNQAGKEQDACNYSPAGAANAYTVGATTNTDSKTSWSNYGNCVNIFAPGAGITAAWHTSNSATNTISGTSMASPHVAGVAALYLAANPGAGPQAVYNALSANSTKNIVANSRTVNNHLLYSLFGEPGEPDPPPPGDGPTISNVASQKVHRNGRFEITWNTDAPAASEVTFTCCGSYSSSTLVTSHRMVFNGSNNVTYEYYVTSTDAQGNATTEGPFYHQN